MQNKASRIWLINLCSAVRPDAMEFLSRDAFAVASEANRGKSPVYERWQG